VPQRAVHHLLAVELQDFLRHLHRLLPALRPAEETVHPSGMGGRTDLDPDIGDHSPRYRSGGVGAVGAGADVLLDPRRCACGRILRAARTAGAPHGARADPGHGAEDSVHLLHVVRLHSGILVERATHTNPSDCQVGLGKCFRWGLTVNQYYGLLFAILAILFVPMTMLKERFDNAKTIHRDLSANMSALWSTLQSRTTLFLIIFVSGNGVFGQMPNQASVYLQYYVIGLNNFQSGIDAVTTYLALVLGIYLFQRYLIRYNWQLTQYFSNIFTAVLAIQWLFAFNDVAGLRNGWFTIFINTNQQFSQGITQVLFAMAVIEIAVPGQEAITYELIISTYNSALTINTMLSTQFLHAAKGSACKFTHWCLCI
jgi:hypothetical protein